MTYRGHIRNGTPVLDQPVELPDGTPVRVEVITLNPETGPAPTLAELAREQAVPAAVDPGELAGHWPDDEPIENFLAFLENGLCEP